MATDAPPAPDDGPIDPVDWDRLDARRRAVSRRLGGLALALAAVAGFYAFVEARDVGLLLGWDPTRLTWLFRLSLVLLAVAVAPPVVRNPARARRYWRRFASDRAAVAALVYLVAVTLLGLVGPYAFGRPRAHPRAALQPPLFFSTPEGQLTLECVGRVAHGQCYGSLAHPLGTTAIGQDLLVLVASGLHVSLQVAVVAAVLIVPVATTVGVVAGYVGGHVDDVLMRYVDVQQSVPAFVVYVIVVFVFGRSLFLLVAVFGLLNWGSIARLVRSEVLQRRNELYVEAAESAGVGRFTVLRRHVLPNVSNTVLVGTTQQIPQLVLLETALTFIGLGDVGRYFQSFGDTIAAGFQGAFGHGAVATWWVWVVPVVFLATTVVALSVVGDQLRDALDPREAA